MDRWSIIHSAPCEDTLHLWIAGKLVDGAIRMDMQIHVVKSDQEVSLMNVKDALAIKMHSIEGVKVMPVDSQVGASAADAVVEKGRMDSGEQCEVSQEPRVTVGSEC